MKASTVLDVTTLRWRYDDVTAKTRAVACVTAFSMHAHMHFVFILFLQYLNNKNILTFSIREEICRNTVTYIKYIYLHRNFVVTSS